jgi:transposase
MPRKRLSMNIQNEILRLKELGHSQRKIARILGVNKETVGRYWYGPITSQEQVAPIWAKQVDWNYITNELKRAPIKIVYEELKEAHSLPSYQAFCSYIRNNHLVDVPPEVVIKIDRTPGASVEVDYSGDSVTILNPATGELMSTELFVSSLSYSGKIYAEFSFSQKLEDFIRAHKNMFSFYGAVPSYIIPDNCKTAVTKTDRYDPKINRTYHDMCKHYGVVVDPADARSPRHKPNVENAVKYIQTDFLSRIRNKTFTSIIELNSELRKWLELANKKPIQGRGESREFFFEKEKPHLRPLPESAYELHYFKQAKVHPDCHFQHDKNYYSVPHNYVGKTIEIKFNSNVNRLYFLCFTHKYPHNLVAFA